MNTLKVANMHLGIPCMITVLNKSSAMILEQAGMFCNIIQMDIHDICNSLREINNVSV